MITLQDIPTRAEVSALMRASDAADEELRRAKHQLSEAQKRLARARKESERARLAFLDADERLNGPL